MEVRRPGVPGHVGAEPADPCAELESFEELPHALPVRARPRRSLNSASSSPSSPLR